jgi:hypothetical protein
MLSDTPGAIMQAGPWQNLKTNFAARGKAASAFRSAKDRPGPRTPALVAVMSHPRYPTANSILKLAAKHGFDVRIKYGPDGRITGFETIGKADEPSGAPCDSARANPWDGVLDAD